MALCLVESYSEAEQIEAAHFGANARWMPTERDQKAAELVRVQFDKLVLGRFQEGMARIRHTRQIPSRAFIKFHCSSGPEMILDGTPIPSGTIIRHASGDEFTERTNGPIEWGTLSLPTEDMIATGITLAGRDLSPPRHSVRLTPSPKAMDRLIRLHGTAAALAKNAPEVLAHAEAARSLEQSLLEALAGCFVGDELTDDRSARRFGRLVIRRFHRVLEENTETPMYIPEICKAIAVSERTLRNCCTEHLGMSPKQYLQLRRMQMARRALQSSAALTATVTEIATQFGFWQLGRFSVTYRSIFGETPSATLRRSKSGFIGSRR